MWRAIVHLDADAFFASVEQAADTRLRGKPIAVGGDSRGIIASASYEARKFGIYTPMPTARARKLCPKLIVLPGDYERYEQFSHWMFGYAYDFTPDVEQTSIDEGYFDLTANHKKTPVEIALIIRKAIGQALKISVSEGLASNKLVSQIASKLHKPAAFQAVPGGQEKQFLQPLPNHWLPGIGPKTAVRLNAAGLADIGQIAATPLDLLALLLGGQAPVLRQFANGIDERPLIPAGAPQKSFSQQETFNEDVTDEEYVEAVLRRMADRLFATVRQEGRSVRTLTVKVRYNDRDENQRAESLREPTDLETDIYGRLRGLLREAWQRRVSLRMVSLKLSNVYEGVFRGELALETNARNHAARERLAVVLDELRRNRGWSVVLRGHDLRLRDAPRRAEDGGQRSEGRKSEVGRIILVLMLILILTCGAENGERKRKQRTGNIQHPTSNIQHPEGGEPADFPKSQIANCKSQMDRRLRSVAGSQLLHVSELNAFACRHRETGQPTPIAGDCADRCRQPARRGRVRASGATRRHQTHFRNRIAGGSVPAAALCGIRARLS